MRFLNGLFWFLLAVVVAIFTYGNWKHVEINLWSGLIADINLPLLLLGFFLAGFVPMALWHQAVKWRLRQRLAATERSAATYATVPTATAIVDEPIAPAPRAPATRPAPTAPSAPLPTPAAGILPADDPAIPASGDLVERAGRPRPRKV